MNVMGTHSLSTLRSHHFIIINCYNNVLWYVTIICSLQMKLREVDWHT